MWTRKPPQWSCDHANRRHSLFLLAILECGCDFLELIYFLDFSQFFVIFVSVCKASVVTMSSQDKVKKGQRKSSFCGLFMAEWDEHHYCPKCRDDLKGDDPCVNSSDCTVCSAFSEEQRKKIKIRNRYKSKKDQNSSLFGDNVGKDVNIDDSLLDEEDSSVQRPASQKGRSLEDKLDRFFTEFASFSERLQNLENKESGTASSRSSGRDSLCVTKQLVANMINPNRLFLLLQLLAPDV